MRNVPHVRVLETIIYKDNNQNNEHGGYGFIFHSLDHSSLLYNSKHSAKYHE